MPQFEAFGWSITSAIRLIWAGERRGNILVKGLDGQQSLIIKRILDTLAQLAEEDAREIETELERFITAIVAAATGVGRAREKVEKALPEFEAKGWHIQVPIERIWAGERDLQSLIEGLDDQDILMIRGVLERLSHLPAEDEKESNGLAQFISDVVAAAEGNSESRAAVELALPHLESGGLHITAAIRRIWAGERDLHRLFNGLDEDGKTIIQWILEFLEHWSKEREP